MSLVVFLNSEELINTLIFTISDIIGPYIKYTIFYFILFLCKGILYSLLLATLLHGSVPVQP
jgi:hypothetical protein